jgi:hypothetical protein
MDCLTLTLIDMLLQKSFGKINAEMADGFRRQYNRVVERLQEIAIEG